MVSTLDELKKLLKLCRSQGVIDIKWGDVEFKLGEMPLKQKSSEVNEEEEEQYNQDELDELTGVPKMAFFSVSEGA
jgi:hypothetical protein